ncbi:hypothetical protein PV325_006772 [Microctonus aethiopoides]|uniref:AAA+ ATPase domain-containing protein n=1 Tax=Microctonus aethiopoides TaxID=144406 RepID=A0AA39C6J9_9HYME|nr:hypothetical protein PV325_006772 [Microctonus aethiopoides]KAK0158420.1 hypothetical protein PV328_009423 [Microctonus aethiopoides]
MDNLEVVECPICMKEFPASTIEVHASKCLFLNESSKEESMNFLKRQRASTSGNQSKLRSPNVNKKIKKTDNENQLFLTSTNQDIRNSFVDNSVDRNETCKNNNVMKNIVQNSAPLAERMRPTSLADYVGQSHVLGEQSLLLQLLNKGEIPNIILWGPPGCGKTSLANVIASICKKSPLGRIRYVKLSAAMVGVAEVKEATKIASNELKFGRRTVIFLDEIHRFNRAQQDIFLPSVESGTITLVGATTENPSFSLNSALLSRCRVIVMEKLTIDNLKNILNRAIADLKGLIYKESTNADIKHSCNIPRFLIDEKTIQFLAETCDGDARIALGGLELAVQSIVPNEDEFLTKGPATISLEDVKESLKKTHTLYDKSGEQHYDMISALHKSLRASDENAALYWLTRMMSGGEDPVYIARRLVRFSSEDVGLEDPKALGIAVHTMHACKMMGMPECDVLLAQCTTYLARAPKSRLMEDSLRAAQRVVANHKGAQPSVPLYLRNAPTKLMKQLGYGEGYNMRHHTQSGLTYLPEGLEHVDFFNGQDPMNAK